MTAPVLYIEDVFVKSEWRGMGIGKALFSHALQVASAEGCGRVEWSVLDWNAPAISFYESLGAKAQDEWIRFRLNRRDNPQLSGLAPAELLERLP